MLPALSQGLGMAIRSPFNFPMRRWLHSGLLFACMGQFALPYSARGETPPAILSLPTDLLPIPIAISSQPAVESQSLKPVSYPGEAAYPTYAQPGYSSPSYVSSPNYVQQPSYPTPSTVRIVEPGHSYPNAGSAPNSIPVQSAPQHPGYRVAAAQPSYTHNDHNYTTSQPNYHPATPPLPSAMPGNVVVVPPQAGWSGMPAGTQYVLVPVPTTALMQPNGTPVATVPFQPNPIGLQGAVPQGNLEQPANYPPQTSSNRVSAESPRTPRPEKLQGLSQQVGRVTAQGFQLAEKRAYYAAREKFEEALLLAAQGVDGQVGSSHRTSALTEARTAFEEAEDFAPLRQSGENTADVQQVIRYHHTPILKNQPANIPPIAALQNYYRFGRQRLVEGTKLVPSAADALHGLGKVHSFLAKEEGETGSLHIARAIAYQQAALDIQPQHPRAANELGVLLAQHGQWQEAKQALVQSLKARPTPETWHNLAVVHQRLGEAELSQRAEWERSQLLAQSGRNGSTANGAVQWVDPRQFAQDSRPVQHPPSSPNQNNATAQYPPAASIHYR